MKLLRLALSGLQVPEDIMLIFVVHSNTNAAGFPACKRCGKFKLTSTQSFTGSSVESFLTRQLCVTDQHQTAICLHFLRSKNTQGLLYFSMCKFCILQFFFVCLVFSFRFPQTHYCSYDIDMWVEVWVISVMMCYDVFFPFSVIDDNLKYLPYKAQDFWDGAVCLIWVGKCSSKWGCLSEPQQHCRILLGCRGIF